MVWSGGKYQEGKQLKIPRGISIYGLTLDNLGDGPEKIISFSDYDYLCIYQETDKPLYAVQSMLGSKEFIYKSDDVFGGTNSYIESYGEDLPGNDIGFYNTYLNSRIIAYDINKTGKRDLIVLKNLTASRILKNVKIFTASEFYNLGWDSMGLSENWRTRKMGGYVADYQIKDIDNDGKDEIVMALVTSSGSMVGRESVIAGRAGCQFPASHRLPGPRARSAALVLPVRSHPRDRVWARLHAICPRVPTASNPGKAACVRREEMPMLHDASVTALVWRMG